MKEQIIKFETAKLANEVGFKKHTSKFYAVKEFGVTFQDSYGTFKVGESGTRRFLDIPFTEYPIISASTQSLLQKWIRDEFNIHVFCVLHYSGSSYIYQIQELGHYFCPNFSDEYKLQYADSPYDTEWERLSYEEMLEQGLVKALQYIKEKELYDA